MPGGLFYIPGGGVCYWMPVAVLKGAWLCVLYCAVLAVLLCCAVLCCAVCAVLCCAVPCCCAVLCLLCCDLARAAK